jgi:hypothetical protein
VFSRPLRRSATCRRGDTEGGGRRTTTAPSCLLPDDVVDFVLATCLPPVARDGSDPRRLFVKRSDGRVKPGAEYIRTRFPARPPG